MTGRHRSNTLLSMNSRNEMILDQVRREALERHIPAADVDQWMALARPSALLAEDGDGPVVGRFGGPVRLPADAEDPTYPLLATINCAALPEGVPDLPLPADGLLLLFDWPEESGMGNVVYVPADAAVTERDDRPASFPFDIDEYAEVYLALPQGELRLEAKVSLPFVGTRELAGPPWSEPLPGHPRSKDLAAVWEDRYIKELSTLWSTPRGQAGFCSAGTERTATASIRRRWPPGRRATRSHPTPRTGCCWPRPR